MHIINSSHDPIIKKIARYTSSSKMRSRDNITLLDGLHIVQEAFTHNPTNLSHIFCTESAQSHSEIEPFVTQLPSDLLYIIPDHVMQKIAPTKTPPGIMGVFNYTTKQKNLSPQAESILLLDHISDPGNLGTIIRTAVSMGVDAIFCSPGCADIWNPKVVRAAQGAHFYTSLFPNFDLTTIKDIFDGRIVGTFLDKEAQSIYDTDLSGKIGICVGNEGAGINIDEFTRYGDERIFIPMAQDFESLNVGIATGMCLSEKRRQDLTA